MRETNINDTLGPTRVRWNLEMLSGNIRNEKSGREFDQEVPISGEPGIIIKFLSQEIVTRVEILRWLTKQFKEALSRARVELLGLKKKLAIIFFYFSTIS